MHTFQFDREEDFNPTELGRHLCLDFDAAIKAFADDPDKRINGILSGYIYDTPQFPDDEVKGGIHYAKYVKLATSLIPQKQPYFLKKFSEEIKHLIEPGMSFFDLGPGPEWSIINNTLPSLKALNPSLYIPVDLEPGFTKEACRVVTREFPNINVKHLTIDFHKEPLPSTENKNSIIWYPGSTLGNLPSFPGVKFLDNKFVLEHLKLLRKTSTSKVHKDSHNRFLILLMDRKKEDISSMLSLYESPDAVNCLSSILFKIRRDLKAYEFNPNYFNYKPIWDEVSSAVNHTFRATKTQKFKIYNCFKGIWKTITVFAGEDYILANSIKPSHTDMRQMLAKSGWSCIRSAIDPERQFHIHLAKSRVEGIE